MRKIRLVIALQHRPEFLTLEESASGLGPLVHIIGEARSGDPGGRPPVGSSELPIWAVED